MYTFEVCMYTSFIKKQERKATYDTALQFMAWEFIHSFYAKHIKASSLKVL